MRLNEQLSCQWRMCQWSTFAEHSLSSAVIISVRVCVLVLCIVTVY